MKISKTDFLVYLDSPKHLWALKNNKLDTKVLNAYVQHLFEQGYQVESYAEKYIKEVLLPKYQELQANSNEKVEVKLQPTDIDGPFEARSDVLIKNSQTGLWDMYEIKSSTKLDKKYIYDATFQVLVFGKSLNIGKVYILHLNSKYIREEELDLSKLFVADDITNRVEKLKDKVHQLRYEALEIVTEQDPSNVLSCIKPKECPCLNLCHPVLPEYSIYDINQITGNEKKVRMLENLGIKSVYDVPDDFKLTEKQEYQVKVAKGGVPVIDKIEIALSLGELKYPLYFVDYESFNPAIPMYKGYKPYDQMPFQWSLHVLKEKGAKLEHYEFIEMQEIDPIVNFLNALQKYIGEEGSIIVWNQSFEKTQNTRMGEIHPQFKEFCDNMNSRVFDLMIIFRDALYADPKFKGSYSIKKVLPVLVRELSYKELTIGEGSTAMASWDEMVHKLGINSQVEKDKIRADLLRYCELDTLAMVKIWEVVEGVVKR